MDKIKKTILSDGTIEYRLNGKLHNENGPAVIKPDGTKEYWINNRKVSKEIFYNITNIEHDVNLAIKDGIKIYHYSKKIKAPKESILNLQLLIAELKIVYKTNKNNINLLVNIMLDIYKQSGKIIGNRKSTGLWIK
jgi:hypothetical protein